MARKNATTPTKENKKLPPGNPKYHSRVPLRDVVFAASELLEQKSLLSKQQIRQGVKKGPALGQLTKYRTLFDILNHMSEKDYIELINKTYGKDEGSGVAGTDGADAVGV